MSLANVFVKVAFIGVISWNLTPLPIFLSDSKFDKKRVPFSVLSAQGPIDQKEYPFSSFANQCNSSLMLHDPFFDFLQLPEPSTDIKACSFQLRKNYFCMLDFDRPIAQQNSITFFLIHTVHW